MKHLLITRLNYHDLRLLKERLKLTREILIPDLIRQTAQFDIAVMCQKQDIHRIEETFAPLEVVTFDDYADLKKYVIENDYQIQTRHDSDDSMNETYMQRIQELAQGETNTLIQCNPTQKRYPSGEFIQHITYTDKVTSGFISLVQNPITKIVYQRPHTMMWQEVDKVITIEGHVTYWIHNFNLSRQTPEQAKKQHKF